DGEVHGPVLERLLDLLEERPLPSHRLETPFQQPVPRGGDDADRDLVPEVLEAGLDVLGLPEGERAAAGPDTDHSPSSLRMRPMCSLALPLLAISLRWTVGGWRSLLTMAEVMASRASSCAGVRGPSRFRAFSTSARRISSARRRSSTSTGTTSRERRHS